MEPYQQRLVEEQVQLAQRINKLKRFIYSQIFKELPQAKRDLLGEQLSLMVAYLKILDQRIELEGV